MGLFLVVYWIAIKNSPPMTSQIIMSVGFPFIAVDQMIEPITSANNIPINAADFVMNNSASNNIIKPADKPSLPK